MKRINSMSRRSAAGLAAVFAVIAVVAVFMASGRKPVDAVTTEASAAATAPAAGDPSAATTSVEEPQASQNQIISDTDDPPDTLTAEDVQKALIPHSLGKSDAPVKITEYASLSCPHCAHFYKETFPKLKEAYIDTGKVQFTYIDFPLDGAALNAAAVAVCMPDESYFKYIEYLFQTQSAWALSDRQKPILVQNAQLLGADGTKLTACINSESLKAGLAERMKTEQAAHQVEATPTFVIDGTDKLQGALGFDQFKTMIDKKLAEKGAPAQ